MAKLQSGKRVLTEKQLDAVTWELRLQGKTLQQIGEAIDRNASNVKRRLDKIIKSVNDANKSRASEWQEVQIGRCESIIEKHWSKRGLKTSADVILKAMDREAKLLGIDAPEKIAPTNPEGDKPYEPAQSDTVAALDRIVAIVERNRTADD